MKIWASFGRAIFYHFMPAIFIPHEVNDFSNGYLKVARGLSLSSVCTVAQRYLLEERQSNTAWVWDLGDEAEALMALI